MLAVISTGATALQKADANGKMIIGLTADDIILECGANRIISYSHVSLGWRSGACTTFERMLELRDCLVGKNGDSDCIGLVLLTGLLPSAKLN